MTDIEAIFARRSRRAYLPEPIPQEQVERIKGLIETVNLKEGLSIQAVFDRPELFGGFLHSYGLFYGVRNFLILAGPETTPDLFEKLGFFGQKLVLELTKMDLGTCWVGGSFDHKSIGKLLTSEKRLAAVIPFGVVPSHVTSREHIIHGFTHRKQLPKETLFTSDGTEPAWFATAMNLVMRSPSALNRMPARFFVNLGIIQSGLSCHEPICFVDLGIAKANFGVACPNGVWNWGEKEEFRY